MISKCHNSSSADENNWHILMHKLGISFSQALFSITVSVARGFLLHPGRDLSI